MSYVLPVVTQDFYVGIAAEDIVDGKLTENAIVGMTQALVVYTHRFLPRTSPGQGVTMHIRMESELR